MAEKEVGLIPQLNENSTVEDILNTYNKIHELVVAQGDKYRLEMLAKGAGFLTSHFNGLFSIIKQQSEELVILRTIELMLRTARGTPEEYGHLMKTLSSFREEVNRTNNPPATSTEGK